LIGWLVIVIGQKMTACPQKTFLSQKNNKLKNMNELNLYFKICQDKKSI